MDGTQGNWWRDLNISNAAVMGRPEHGSNEVKTHRAVSPQYHHRITRPTSLTAAVNRPEEFIVARRMLAHGMAVNPEKLVDESVDPKEFPSAA